MRMPKFSNPGGVFPSLPFVPPFYFENMTVRMFPLRARLATLQGFVDRYLNIVPGEVGRFRVALPYVYLMLIDYGKLASQTGNVGYVAQREVMFLVPTQWFKVGPDGRWEFHDWAIATPFIFVDDFLAMVIGRQMYGWPKLLCRLSPVMNDWLTSDPRAPTLTPSRWMQDPRSGLTAATISTPVFSDVYAGGEQQWRVLLEVDRAPPFTPFEVPMNLTSAYAPWVAMGNAAAAMTGFARDWMGMLSGMGIVPLQPGADPESYARMAEQAAWMANPFRGRTPPAYPNTGGGPSTNLYGNTLNLQQFRDSRYPAKYCFQALTSAAMSVVSFNAGGLLGDMSMFFGDPSGGYRIRMYDWPSMPIVDMLGLERAGHTRGDGVQVSELEPVMPFWYQVDMIYERGVSIAWRSFDTIWRDQEGKPFGRSGGEPSAAKSVSAGLPDEGKLLDPESLYNSTLGASTQTVAGPFSYPCSTVRVLPLIAKRKTLEKFLDEYLNDAIASTGKRFELWCSNCEDSEHAYVYAMIWCYGDTASGTDNIGSWAKDDLSFMVPVRYREGGELRSLGLVPVYTFVDDTTSPIADTEVLGWPTNKGTFVQPPNVWLNDAGAEAHQPLLRISAQVFPSVAQGQEAVERVVLEIDQGELVDEENAQLLADEWALLLRDEVERKKKCVAAVVGHEERGTDLQRARSLAIEILANERPVNVFTVKQFRDVHDPSRAAYQSVVRIERTIKKLFELREIEEPLHLRIQEYPSLPVIQLLGLVATLASDQKGGVTYMLRPVRPFWMRMAWEESLGRRMMYRCGSEEWQGLDEKGWRPYFGDDAAPEVDVALSDLIDDGRPDRIDFLTHEWKRLGGKGMKLADARDAVEAIEPQSVIETILSREWENWGTGTRWREHWKSLDGKRKDYVKGKQGSQRRLADVLFFMGELDKVVPGRRHYIEPKVWRLAVLGAACARMEGTSIAAPEATKEAFSEGLRMLTAPELLHSDRSMVAIAVADAEGDVASIAARPGDPETPLLERSDAARHKMLLQRLHALGAIDARYQYDEKTFYLFWSWSEADPSPRSEVAELVREAYRRQRQSVLDRMSKADQKPGFCVQRSVAGSQKDRIFPKQYSWKGWYVGPQLTKPQKDK